MNELRDKCKKAASITVLLLYMIAAFVCGYCIEKEMGDRRRGKAMLDVSLVKRMREAQKQWGDGDPFDYTEVELAKRMDETEKEVDEWLKRLK